MAALVPFHDLPAGLLDHPLADRHDAAAGLRDRDEGARQHQAAGRMVPADQRLQPDDRSGFRSDLRLIVQLELVALDRVAQILGDRHALARLVVELGDVEAELVAAFVLGAVEREIGLHHHGVGAGDVAAVGHHADADAGGHLVAADRVGPGDRPCRSCPPAPRCCRRRRRCRPAARRIRRRRSAPPCRFRARSSSAARRPRAGAGRPSGGRACR